MTLFYICTNHTALLRSRLLRYSLWWCTVQRHLHSLRPLVRVRLGGTGRRWRKILWWRICVLVQRRGFRPCAVLPLCVLWVGCVGVLCLVKGEVVLGNLAMAATFRVGYQKLLHFLLVFDGVDTEWGRGVRRTRWYPSSGRPFLNLCFAWIRPPTNHPKKMTKNDASIIHFTIIPFCSIVSLTSREQEVKGRHTSVYQKPSSPS